jgi:hypothetical protein
MADVNLRFPGRDLYGGGSFFAYLAAVEEVDLLEGETGGLAIDFTDTDDFALSTWAMQAVQERNSSVDTLQSPHVFFTQSGTSPKYVKTSATGIGWSPHNVILQSQTFDNASWDRNSNSTTVSANATTAPDGTSTADKLVESSGGSFHIIRQVSDNSTLNVNIFTASCYAKAAERTRIVFSPSDEAQSNGLDIVFDLSGGQIGVTAAAFGSGYTKLAESIVSVGSGWYRCIITFSGSADRVYHRILTDSGSGTGAISHNYSGDGSSGVYLWGAQVNRGFAVTPYITTVASVVNGLPISYGEGLLVEPAATNLVTNSQVVGSWNNINVTQAADNTTAPDGSTTADKITANSGNAVHLSQAPGFTDAGGGQNYTASLYVKSSTAQYVMCAVVVSTTTWINSVFDVTGGSVTQTGAGAGGTFVSSSITSIGSGWYRISVTGQMGGGTANVNLHVVDTGTPTVGNFSDYSWNPAGTEAVWLWGAQVETGTVATSYVPTVGSSATRAIDNISAPVSQWSYGSSNSLYGDITPRQVTAQADFLAFDANNSNEDESVFLYTDSSANILMRIEDGGSAQLAPLDSGQNAVANTRFQVAASWATNDVDYSAEGQTAVTDGTATMPTVTHLRLGTNPTPGNALNGFIRRLVHVPRHVETDAGNLETWRYNF